MMTKKLFLAALCFTALSLSAQDAPVADVPLLGGGHPKNYVKTNLFGMPFRNFNLNYERAQFKFLSVGVDYRIMPEGRVPLSGLVKSTLPEDFGIADAISGIKVKGSALTPYLRFYPTHKGYGRGFYIQAQYRNVNYSMDNVEFGYTDSQNKDQKIILNGTFKSNTYGLSLGKQWTVAKFLVIDWVMSGFQFGNAVGNFAGDYSTKMSAQDQQSVEDAARDLSFDVPFINKPVRFEADAGDYRTTVKIKSPWFMPMMGLSIGVRF